MRDPLELIRIQIQYSNHIGAGLNNRSLELVHHDEAVDGVGELVTKQLFSILVDMHNTVTLLAAHQPCKNKGLVHGLAQVEYFVVVFSQFDVGFSLDYHSVH